MMCVAPPPRARMAGAQGWDGGKVGWRTYLTFIEIVSTIATLAASGSVHRRRSLRLVDSRSSINKSNFTQEKSFGSVSAKSHTPQRATTISTRHPPFSVPPRCASGDRVVSILAVARAYCPELHHLSRSHYRYLRVPIAISGFLAAQLGLKRAAKGSIAIVSQQQGPFV